MGSDSDVFEDNFLHSMRILVSHIDGCSECSVSLTEVTPIFNLKNHSKTCVLPTACTPKATSDTYKSFSSSFHQFILIFDVDMLLFEV